jgi:hypothetical protein
MVRELRELYVILKPAATWRSSCHVLVDVDNLSLLILAFSCTAVMLNFVLSLLPSVWRSCMPSSVLSKSIPFGFINLKLGNVLHVI